MPASDAALVEAANAGSGDAADALLRRHHDRLYAVCRRVVCDDADASDATQEAMIAIVRGLARFDRRSEFATWSHRIAVNAALDELRRRRRRPVPVTEIFTAAVTADVGAGVADRLDIDAALARLPVDYRVAVVLRDVSGLAYAEIAEILGIPIGTVRSRIARARAALAAALHPADNPAPRLVES